MGFLSAVEIAEFGHIRSNALLFNRSRTFLSLGKTWNIPADAVNLRKCQTSSTSPLLTRLIEEKFKNKGWHLN